MSNVVHPLEVMRRQRLLCRIEFGLTVYLDSPPRRDEVLAAYDAYRQVCPPQHRTLVKAPNMLLWEPVRQDEDAQLAVVLKDQDRRRDHGMVVWDGDHRSRWSFWMQGVVGPKGEDWASFCEIFLPEDIDPSLLHWLALELTDRLSLSSGHAGFAAVFNPRWKRTAFDQIYAWAKRYPGLEVGDLNRTLPCIRGHIKGANWLTLINRNLWDQIEAVNGATDLSSPVSAEWRRHAIVVRAGANPVLGDRNRGQWPEAYAAVEQWVQPLKVVQHPEFAGRFAEEGETRAWLHRLVERDAW